MKKHILTFIMTLSFVSIAFTQNTVRNDASHLSAASTAFQKSDTVFYEDGKIKYISLYPRTGYKTGSGQISGFELQKKVYQYDKCGNLRNITEISRYTGQINSCHDYYFKNPYQIKDNFITNIECTEVWTKPLIMF